MVGASSSLRQQALAVLAITVALVAQQVTMADPWSWLGWAIFAGAAALMLAAGWPRDGGAAHGEAALGSRSAVLTRALWAAVAVLAVALTTVVSTLDRWPVGALLLWVGGFAAATIATHRWVIAPVTRGPVSWTRSERLGLVAIVAIAVVDRLLWIDTIPRYFFGDEPRVATFLWREYRQGGIPNFFRMGWNTWPVIGLSVQGIFAPFVGLHTVTLRYASALMGILAVPATYLLARELYTPRVALLAALLLAIGRTAVDFSRLGTCHAQVIFLEPFAFFWWWRAINTGRAGSYLWAGIAMGLCLYTYNAGQSVPVLWVGWVLLSVLLAPRRAPAHWRGVLVTVAGLLLAVFPWAYYVTDHFTFARTWFEWTYMARNRQTMSLVLDAWHHGGWGAAAALLGGQAARTWFGFGVLPAGAYQLGYRGGGMLDRVSAPLFVLGLAMSLVRLRGRGGFVPYWWLFTVIVGGILTNDPPAFVRLIGILPAVAILAALPLDALLRSFTPARYAVVGTVLTAGLLLVAAWDNAQAYFIAFPREPVDEQTELVRLLEQEPANTAVFILGSESFLRFFNEEIFPLDFEGRRLEDVGEPAHFFPIHEPFTAPVMVVLGPSQTTLADYVRALYPQVRRTDVIGGTDQRLMFRVLHLQPEDLERRAGLTVRPGAAAETTGAAPIADPFAVDPHVPAAGQPLVWAGSIYWPTDAPVQLTVRAAQALTLHLDDLPEYHVGAAEPTIIAMALPRGWHPLTLDAAAAGPLNLAMAIDDKGTRHAFSRWDLRPDAAAEGLTAVYERDGKVVARTIDPQLDAYADESGFAPPHDLPFRRPFTATWEGLLRVTETGTYELEVRSSGAYSIELDGQPFCQQEHVQPGEIAVCKVSRQLASGPHPLRARWDGGRPTDPPRRIFQVFWTPPGGAKVLIPPENFQPAPAEGQAQGR